MAIEFRSGGFVFTADIEPRHRGNERHTPYRRVPGAAARDVRSSGRGYPRVRSFRLSTGL